MGAPQRFLLLLAAALIAAVMGGCASTEITSSWKDESFGRVPFRKTLVVFQHRDAGMRRVLEDEMARSIPASTPAYAVLKDEEIRDLDRVKARVRELGFDSAVVMRVAGVERERTLVTARPFAVPMYYRGFWGYWGYGWGTVYDPAYLRTDRIVHIATNVYDVNTDKLVWASESETFNPVSLRDAIAEVVKVTSKATGEALRSTARG